MNREWDVWNGNYGEVCYWWWSSSKMLTIGNGSWVQVEGKKNIASQVIKKLKGLRIGKIVRWVLESLRILAAVRKEVLRHLLSLKYWNGDSLWLSGREHTCQAETWVHPWVGKIPWRRKWQPTPVFLSGKSMDRGAWWVIVARVGQTQLTD